MTLKIATQEEAPQRRPNVEPRGMIKQQIHLDNPLVRELKVPRNYPVVGLVYILRGEEIRGNIPRAKALKSSINPSHPLFMEKLKRGKKLKLNLGCLADSTTTLKT
jgi:hypothetical protein